MTQLTVKIVDGAVRQGIRNVANAIPDIHFRHLWRLMNNAANRRREYPSPPPNSTYERTGAFGASVSVEKLGAGSIGARLRIDVDYASYVGGFSDGEGQAAVHEGRWELTKDIVDQEVTLQLSDLAGEDLAKVIREQGFGL